MAKFGINDILNAKTKAAGQQAQTDGYKEIYLSPYEVKAAQENTHQKLENIEELADSFLHVGQEQPTVLARVNGEYRIIDGHRRNAANILNLERGHKEYEKVLYRFMDMSEAMYELRLLAGNGYTQELTAYEKTRLVERTKAALIRAKEEDGLEIQAVKYRQWKKNYKKKHGVNPPLELDKRKQRRLARKMARQINKTLPTAAETLTAALNCWVQSIKPALATLCENVAAAFSNMAAGLREESEAVEND